MNSRWFVTVLLLLLTLTFSTLAGALEPSGDPGPDPFAEEDAQSIADPIEPVNRAFFWVNDKLYFYLFKPIARGFRIVPEPGRAAVKRAFANLLFPVRFAGNLLQFKFRGAGIELDRFLVNSTIGLAGLFDPAKNYFHLDPQEEDLDQTFGHYGIGHGFYLVLPVFGPSSLRDGVGGVGDLYLDPMIYAGLKDWEYYGITGVTMLNALSLDKDTYEQIKEDALDPYLFVRNAYVQRRQAQVDR
jgi:phospholipid-binding lipoprotein MlaA